MAIKKNKLQIVFLVTAVFFLTVFCLGCGKKGNPVPPEITTPAAVSDLSVRTAEEGIILGWSVPKSNTDVAGFKIYRSEMEIEGDSCPGCPREYSLIADLSCHDPKLGREGERDVSYLDSNVKTGCLYSYKVMTCNSSGYCSGEANIAEIKNR